MTFLEVTEHSHWNNIRINLIKINADVKGIIFQHEGSSGYGVQ